MSENTGLVEVLKERLDSGDKAQKALDTELKSIYKNSKQLGQMVNHSYHINGTAIPIIFKKSGKFLLSLDETKKAVGNTIRILGIFKTQNVLQEQTEKTTNPQSPIIIMNKDNENPQPTRLPVKGFLSGIHDRAIAKMELEAKTRREERPIITTEKVTHNLEDAIHQILPTLNQIKDRYFQFQDRAETYPTENPSRHLLLQGHKEIRKEINKLLLIVDAFCYASIEYQKEKIQNLQVHELDRISKIAEAEATAQANAPIGTAEIYHLVREAAGAQDAGR